MNWKTIMKESRKDKERIYEDSQGYDERRTKTSGGAGFDEDKFGRIKDIDEDSFEDHDNLNEADLVEMTRQDLIETAIDWIESLGEEDLLNLLISSLGQINIGTMTTVDNNRKD